MCTFSVFLVLDFIRKASPVGEIRVLFGVNCLSIGICKLSTSAELLASAVHSNVVFHGNKTSYNRWYIYVQTLQFERVGTVWPVYRYSSGIIQNWPHMTHGYPSNSVFFSKMCYFPSLKEYAKARGTILEAKRVRNAEGLLYKAP